MGIEAEFKEISPYLLDKIRNHPDFIDLFLDAKYLPDSAFWEEFTTDLNDPNDAEFFELSRSVEETLERLEKEKPQELEALQADIPRLLLEGKSSRLDVDKTWNWLHFFMTGYFSPNQPPVLISKNEEDNLPSINAVLGGKETECHVCYDFVRYFTVEEVATIAENLERLTTSHIRERIRFRNLKEDTLEHLFDYTYHPLVNYYNSAASKGNAMFLHLT